MNSTIILYTDGDNDMGDSWEYTWIGRWTAKSLIITADPTCKMSLYRQGQQFIIPRKKVEEQLKDGGFLHHKRESFSAIPVAERRRLAQEKREADPVYQQQQREQQERDRQTDEAYAVLSESRKELIRLYAKDCNISTDNPDYKKLALNLSKHIEANGGEEYFMAKLTGKSYRSIDAV